MSGILGTADLSRDGKLLAFGSWDPFITRILDLDSGGSISLLGFEGPIVNVQFSPDVSLLFVAARLGPCHVYDRT